MNNAENIFKEISWFFLSAILGNYAKSVLDKNGANGTSTSTSSNNLTASSQNSSRNNSEIELIELNESKDIKIEKTVSRSLFAE